MKQFRIILASCAAFVLAGVSVAQDAPPKEKEDNPPAKQDAEKPKSLDELLDLDPDEDAEAARESAEAEVAEELERALNEERISDAFKDAIRQMAIAASMLGEKFDSGLATQRVQEEIMRKLDELINAAQQQQSNSSNSSSSSQQQSQQQQQQTPRPQQSNQQQDGQPQQNQAANPSGGQAGSTPPEEQGDISSMLEEMGVEWGKLPPRQRDMLLQTLRDKPSSLYRRLTESYYRRLAEESSR